MKKKINQKDTQGRRHGLCEWYRPDGTISWRSHYHHGVLHGLWERYLPDGHLWERSNWHHGVLHGIWELYRSDGTTYAKQYHIRIR